MCCTESMLRVNLEILLHYINLSCEVFTLLKLQVNSIKTSHRKFYTPFQSLRDAIIDTPFMFGEVTIQLAM